ncbi:MAG: hypothetical protein KatS3mg092_0901 [Patescibacteria group bacterium]|nr:MAG: hypothetical protein KatS3mg092_0901 [Patescibacteria group bacterium]
MIRQLLKYLMKMVKKPTLIGNVKDLLSKTHTLIIGKNYNLNSIRKCFIGYR